MEQKVNMQIQSVWHVTGGDVASQQRPPEAACMRMRVTMMQPIKSLVHSSCLHFQPLLIDSASSMIGNLRVCQALLLVHQVLTGAPALAEGPSCQRVTQAAAQ
jgi:hypothetical protein